MISAAPAEAPDTTTPRSRITADGVDDATLVSRALGGDRWAHEAIFRRYVDDVLGLATRMLGDASEADDVAQDTFTVALSRLERLEDRTRLRSWLIGIAVHRVRRRFRSRRWLRFVGMGGEGEIGLFELASSSASPEVKADLALIDGLLHTLPSEERIAWMLRAVEGEALEDIATITGASLATVKRRIHAVEVRLGAMVGRGTSS